MIKQQEINERRRRTGAGPGASWKVPSARPRFPLVLYGATLAGVVALLVFGIFAPAYAWGLTIVVPVAVVAVLLTAVLFVYLPRWRHKLRSS